MRIGITERLGEKAPHCLPYVAIGYTLNIIYGLGVYKL